MAEFCLDCYNKYFAPEPATKKDVLLGEDLCEGCGEWKPCVIRLKHKNMFVELFYRIYNPCRAFGYWMKSEYVYKYKNNRRRKH